MDGDDDVVKDAEPDDDDAEPDDDDVVKVQNPMITHSDEDDEEAGKPVDVVMVAEEPDDEDATPPPTGRRMPIIRDFIRGNAYLSPFLLTTEVS